MTDDAHDTLDGGAPNFDKIMLELRTFTPGIEALFGGDKHELVAMREAAARVNRRPTPLCGACDYEFELGEVPTRLYYTCPAFPKAKEYTFIAGAICSGCARLPEGEILAALVRYLREIKPDIEIMHSQ